VTVRASEASCRGVCLALRPASSAVGRAWGCRVITSVACSSPLVALTVDDGPHPATTPGLLDALSRHGATATFFLIGSRAAAYPSLVGRIVDGGHELGNHLMRDEPSVRLGAVQFRDQLRRVHEQLSVSAPVRCFRPGSGWFRPRMLAAAAELDYVCVLGSPLLLATDPREPARAGRRIGGTAHPGSVAVLHEGTPERAAVALTADEVLRRLRLRGLRAVSVAGLLSA
jgi:peptidoglycan/xylan/chitin deacetylase (PgdA/CDA1 family)